MAKGKSDTAIFYQQNPESAQHHSDTNNSAHPKNKFAHSKAYKRKHAQLRRKEGIMGKGGPDMSKQPDG